MWTPIEGPNRKLLSQGGGGPVIGTWRRYDMRRSNNVTIVTKVCSRLLDLFWECFRKKRARERERERVTVRDWNE